MCSQYPGKKGELIVEKPAYTNSEEKPGQENPGTGTRMLHGETTRRIIGCAMRVHSTLGNGFQEVIYQRALEIEMTLDGLKFEREKTMPIFYHGQSIGKRRVDFFVENAVMVELKAVIDLEDVHLAQAMNYLEAYKMKIGLLINFGARSLVFKRVHNNRISEDAPAVNA